ncbi:unnamed protein product, partial [Closterium sp. Naga37s-1]
QFLKDFQRASNQDFTGWNEMVVPDGVYCEYDEFGNELYCERATAQGTFCDFAEGISCDTSGMIVRMFLESFYLPGTIPASISNLRELTDLDLSGNELRGSLPTDIFTLTKLTHLRLDTNQFTGSIPSAIGMLTDLISIGFGENQFTGPIPGEISKLMALKVVNCDRNQLAGSIPSDLGNLGNLEELYLGGNQLEGPIPPATLSPLTALKTLTLASNKFTGNLSFVSTLSTKLETLTINNNQFSGSIPSAIGTRFLNLQYFDASHNYLSGPISVLPWYKMDLSSNYLTGPLNSSASLSSRLVVNCFTQPECPLAQQHNCSSTQRPAAECTAFCGGANACDGRGICYPDGPSLVPTCLCQPGYMRVGRFNCFTEGWDRGLSISKTILPVFSILTKGTQRQTAGTFMAKPVTLFAYPKPQSTGCGAELAFSVNFTFCLIPQNGTGGSNGFAFVIAAKGKVGKADGVGYGGMDRRSVAIEFDTLQNANHNDLKEQHIGLNINGSDSSLVAVESPFTLTDGEFYTAWVDYDPWNSGTIQVFLATSREKPEQPLLQRELSLCAVLQPSGQQPAFFFGFVASTTVKPFQMHGIAKSAMRTEMSPPRKPVQTTRELGLTVSESTFAPPGANPFSRYVSMDYQWTDNDVSVDSWAIRDFHAWNDMAFLEWPVKDQLDCSACWAYAVVASVEAAYGIALDQAAPQLSVEPLFAAMGLTGTDKCTAGGSPTAAFEKLVTVDASSGLTETSDPATTYPVAAFERALFKGYFGLMLAVRRQPVVVHIEASADTFFQYDGTFKYQDPACYTGSLNHVVLVVGYFINRDDGSQNRIAPPFWIIRNSWGVEWGDKGHMRMGIQGGDGVCGINVLPGIYPVVK